MALRALATAAALAGATAQFTPDPPSYYQDGSPWYKQGQYEVKRRAQTQANTKRAKNVSLVVADGNGAGLLTQGGQGGRPPPWPRDCIAFQPTSH
jgi:hypothetical protein